MTKIAATITVRQTNQTQKEHIETHRHNSFIVD